MYGQTEKCLVSLNGPTDLGLDCSHTLKVNGYSVVLYKGESFWNFIFPFLHMKGLMKRVYSKGEQILSF